MASHLKLLESASSTLNVPHKWISDNLHYEVIMGSHAYGVNREDSDFDIYGWCIPPVGMVFPHTEGYIEGFGPPPPTFDVWHQAHITHGEREYDFSIYGIAKFLHLCVENNPNMIDSLFVPQNCITHITSAGQIVRDNRRTFLHKGSYHKLKGYAYSQVHKMGTKAPKDGSKRREDVDQHGLDTKFAYHTVRLVNQCRQILEEGDLDLQRDNEILKSVRRGEWTKERVLAWFQHQERMLEEVYVKSSLPHGPDWVDKSRLLHNVLESHYGSIDRYVATDHSQSILRELRALVDQYS